ncbi:MAG TPA: hypothetical protein VJU82_00895 [Acidobacteriaceae bacterium]|nr:hypothetical protein [Acidobacteriaceae bacterium]
MSRDQVAYWISDETPSTIRDRAAMYFLPGPDPDPPHALSETQLEEATDDQMATRHRIVIHIDYELPEYFDSAAVEAFFAAVVRHELEHARQAEAPDGRLALEVDQNLVDPLLFRRAGGIKGGAEYYNMKPSEMDANAAASVYVRSRFPDQVPILLEADVCGAMLRSNTEPEDPASLLRRNVCFLFQFRSIAEALSAPLPVASHLELYGGADAAAIWSHLTA